MGQELTFVVDVSDIAVFLLSFSIFIGILMHQKFLWHFRILTCIIMAVLIGSSIGFILVSSLPAILVCSASIVQAYRLFSYLRVVKNRLAVEALRKRSFRSEIIFSLMLVTIFAGEFFVGYADIYSVLLIVTVLQFIFAVIFLQKVNSTSVDTKIPKFHKHIPDVDLPSITVAIPARNETEELSECLQSILKSNYPKMEVIVLDDCSQDNTSDIIKSFAHKGVRFLEGTIPRGSWLAKNHAYQQLLEESEGSLVVFCGVDVRYEQDSLRKIVEIFIHQKNSMASVMPTRNGLHGVHNIVQPMRYWRELAFPKIFSRHPAFLSTFWIADRKFLEKCGGFSAFKQSIRPEKHFAKRAKQQKGYEFYRSSSGLGISSIKTYKNQINTAIRTRYPEHKKQPENVLVYSVWFLVIFVMPMICLVLSLTMAYFLPSVLSLFSIFMLLFVHAKVDYLTNGIIDYTKLIIFPITVISEVVIINYSMWAYEFSDVIWKGRNVCLPVLKIVPRLPKI